MNNKQQQLQTTAVMNESNSTVRVPATAAVTEHQQQTTTATSNPSNVTNKVQRVVAAAAAPVPPRPISRRTAENMALARKIHDYLLEEGGGDCFIPLVSESRTDRSALLTYDLDPETHSLVRFTGRTGDFVAASSSSENTNGATSSTDYLDLVKELDPTRPPSQKILDDREGCSPFLSAAIPPIGVEKYIARVLEYTYASPSCAVLTLIYMMRLSHAGPLISDDDDSTSAAGSSCDGFSDSSSAAAYGLSLDSNTQVTPVRRPMGCPSSVVKHMESREEELGGSPSSSSCADDLADDCDTFSEDNTAEGSATGEKRGGSMADGRASSDSPVVGANNMLLLPVQVMIDLPGGKNGIKKGVKTININEDASPQLMTMQFNNLLHQQRVLSSTTTTNVAASAAKLLTPLSMWTFHRLFYSSLILAIKWLEDKTYVMSYYANVGGFPSTIELCRLEREAFFRLGFQLWVTPEEWEKACALLGIGDLPFCYSRRSPTAPSQQLRCPAPIGFNE